MYLIEWEMPGAAKMTARELQAFLRQHCGVFKQADPSVRWIQSYTIGDQIYCVCTAPNKEVIHEYAWLDALPLIGLYEMGSTIGPPNAEG